MMTQEKLINQSFDHKEYGKLTLRRNYTDIKFIAKRKFIVISQDNDKEIVYLQMDDNKEVIPVTFSVMIYLLRNY